MMGPTASAARPPASPRRRSLLAAGMAGAAAAALRPAPAAATGRCPWSEWDRFVEHFVQADGRVLDASTPRRHSSSEGQSYAMFFALVANDAPAFERIWRWSVANLCGGDLAANLPAWLWGLGDDGQWGVIDRNSASDGDLWFAYSLFEAGRLWRRPDYTRDAQQLLANIEAREIADLPGLGKMLLPGAEGFARPEGIWKINPSYLAVFQFQRLALESPGGPWLEIAANTVRLMDAVCPKGFVADWVAYEGTSAEQGRFALDPDKGATGSYDAIRAYLWAGMLPAGDPASLALLASLDGMARIAGSPGYPPETVQVLSGEASGSGPFGFSAALLPYLQSCGQAARADEQRARVQSLWSAALRPESIAQRQPPYYDYVLSLFGTGWQDQRYRFLGTGHVQLQWEKTCPLAATP